MDKGTPEIFQIEVGKQCRFALIAFGDLKGALNGLEMDRIWYSIQGFLGAAGNISKLLWANSKPSIPERCIELRESLCISDSSPLEPRTFRNHFEHFDERLERWAKSPQRHHFVDSNVGSIHIMTNVSSLNYLRNFDPVSNSVTYRGDTYELQPIVDEILQIEERLASISDSKST